MENGTVVVFEPKNFNPEFWNNLPEKDRIKYYGPLGYGSTKKKFFVFLTEIITWTFADGTIESYKDNNGIIVKI